MDAKGTAVMTVPAFVKNRFGDAGYQKWMAALSPQAKKVFEVPVLAPQWFPLKPILGEPTKVVCDLFYSGQIKGAWELGRFSAEQGLKGIYKLFVKFGSAEFIVGKASSIFPTYYNPSAMESKLIDKNSCMVKITKFPEPDVYVEARICGWMEAALSISGFKDVGVTVNASMTKGAAASEFTVRWKDK